MLIKPARALLSVSDKTGIVPFAQFLHQHGVELISTGGTFKTLHEAGLPVIEISAHTGFPEMMDGRVKTLHPTVHGGLLGRRDTHAAAMREHNIPPIDLLVVNLYPFEATVERGADYEDCIENIDIGGPAMIRSSAKNHEFVAVVVEAADYEAVMADMNANGGSTSLELRKRLAATAYSRTAAYDAAISTWFAGQLGDTAPKRLTITAELKQALVYGENPHQKAAYYTFRNPTGLGSARQLHGKELSYNNLNDTDAAWELVQEFEAPAAAIIKHANPCGVAVADSQVEAYRRALACDPVSAFGGIIALNRPVDVATAQEIATLFAEAVVAPAFTPEALAILQAKKNIRLLEITQPVTVGGNVMKSVSGGVLVQERDGRKTTREELKVVTRAKPTDAQIDQLLFAQTVVKHVKSNAIVVVSGNAAVGVGAGQMSRVKSVEIAIEKAQQVAAGTNDWVLASDAFFPFPDSIELVAKAGIKAVIQPGGSIRDEEVVKAADEHGIAMVLTGLRHFRH